MRHSARLPDPSLFLPARGFTLLEVLTAMAVLAIALGAAIKALSDGAHNAAQIEERTLAHWLALNKIAEQRLKPVAPAVGMAQGSSPFAGRNWHWTAVVSATPDVTTRRLQVEIRRRADEDQPLLTRTAFLSVSR